jgi:hypothetical protein
MSSNIYHTAPHTIHHTQQPDLYADHNTPIHNAHISQRTLMANTPHHNASLNNSHNISIEHGSAMNFDYYTPRLNTMYTEPIQPIQAIPSSVQ